MLLFFVFFSRLGISLNVLWIFISLVRLATTKNFSKREFCLSSATNEHDRVRENPNWLRCNPNYSCRLWILGGVPTRRVTLWRRYGRSLQKLNTWNGSMNPTSVHGNCKPWSETFILKGSLSKLSYGSLKFLCLDICVHCDIDLTLSLFVVYLRETCEAALKEKLSLDSSQTEGFLDDTIDSNSAKLEALGNVFEKAAEADLPTEVAIKYTFVLALSKRFRPLILWFPPWLWISGAWLPML